MLFDDETWFFPRLNDRVAPPFNWSQVWVNPRDVSPDPLVQRDRIPTKRERALHERHVKKRRDRIETYRKAVPRKYADMNLLCLHHYNDKTQLLFHGLMPLLEQYVYFEWLMKHDPAKPWYRDHLIHQLRVAFLGDFFLNLPYNTDRIGSPVSGPDPGYKLVDNMADRIRKIVDGNGPSDNGFTGASTIKFLADSLGVTSEAIDPALVRCAYWLAALFHDTGYVFSFYAKMAQTVHDVYAYNVPDPMLGLEGTFRNQSAEVLFHFLEQEALACRRWLSQRQSLRLPAPDTDWRPPAPNHVATAGMGPAFLVQLFRKGHSAVGALNFLYVMESLIRRGEVTPEFRFAAGLAALAILRHDTDDWRPKDGDAIGNAGLVRDICGDRTSCDGWLVTGRIGFAHDPVSALLVLCDHVQEWDRYKTETEVIGPVGRQRDVETIVHDFDHVEVKIKSDRMEIQPFPVKGKPVPPGTLNQYRKEKPIFFGKDGTGGWVDMAGFMPAIVFKDPPESGK